MGVGGGRPASRRRGGCPLTLVRVVPDVPTLPLDTGFVYEADDTAVVVGSQVRVPLGGRTVRGWVVEVDAEPPDRGLRRITALSGEVPTFHAELLTVVRWVAQHYVAPLSAVLSRTAPPNLSSTVEVEPWSDALPSPNSPIPEVTTAAQHGRHVRSHYLLSPSNWVQALIDLSVAVLSAERSVLAIFPTAGEAESAAASLQETLGDRVMVATGRRSDRAVTEVWDRAAQQPGCLVVGTPRVLLWPVAELALGVVIQEGRAGHKEKQTPTIHSREVMRRRSAVERFPLVFMGRVPTTELVAAGTAVVGNGRSWPLVEIVDRKADPSLGLFTDHVTAVVQGAVRRGERVFVFTHRHGYAPAFLCASCRTLRTCERCGSRLDRDGTCARCGHHQLECASCGGRRFTPLGAGTGRVTAELARFVDRSHLGTVADELPVSVGTERDLPFLTTVDVAVAVDADGLLMGTNYRAAEDALRVLARVAASVGRGRGRRAVVQTARPDHPVIIALRRGDPMPFLEREVFEREQYRLPPMGEIIVLEVTEPPEWAVGVVGELAGPDVAVLGPAGSGRAQRWLLQGSDLGETRTQLRSIAHRMRDAKASVRIDVDPIEL